MSLDYRPSTVVTPCEVAHRCPLVGGHRKQQRNDWDDENRVRHGRDPVDGLAAVAVPLDVSNVGMRY